jgi:hypothetical protein
MELELELPYILRPATCPSVRRSFSGEELSREKNAPAHPGGSSAPYLTRRNVGTAQSTQRSYPITGGPMTNDEQRSLRDRVAREEAASRAAEQVSAGQDHGPVEVYPAHGAPSRIPRSMQATYRLAQAYTCALEVERSAWELLPALPGDPAFAEAPWNAWRSAVEDREATTRLLINYALTQP